MLSITIVILAALSTTAWAAGAEMRPTVEPFIQTVTVQPTPTLEEATTSSASEAATHTVNVGATGHKFTPAEVKAEVGDVIEWRFYPDAHWIIRGDFEQPCIPYEYFDLDRKGFSSGTQKGPRFRVQVNDTDPIFFYCGAPSSCQKYHMMGVVNPSQNETLEDWLDKGKEVDYQLRPGEPWPKEGGSPSETANPEDDDKSNSEDGEHGSSHLSTGAIAGIAIGSAAVLILAGGLIYLCGRRGGFDKAYRKSFRSSHNPPGVSETQFSSPNPTSAVPWAANKGPGLTAAPYGQSPPMSPHHSLGYGTHPALASMVAQDGTTGSYYSDTYTQQQPAASPSQGGGTPKPAEQTSPVELPGSVDPGNAPQPNYSNAQTRTFSWAGEETGYRPTS
ncbi:hypothetical protein FZEAL_1268 [Fusarium zealandicum]|uniref:Extracellular serine-rich protein n=1 Tax=Fusarium zealandicum TaxID=1053134 RepID=A0A8H4UTW8_9HYPO|nr:hypothetical protein FZEAL_1268 [Fusarium zealandicum]